MMNKNKNEESVAKFFAPFIVLWVIGARLSLGFVGVVIWAIIKLVGAYT